MNCGLFLYPATTNSRTSNTPLWTKFRYQIVTEKPMSDYCNGMW
nr:MAG TPA: neurotoxin [Caudoviricetes sp.]